MPLPALLFSLTLCLFAATPALAGPVAAVEDTEGNPVITSRLVASHAEAPAGQTVGLAWQFTLQPGWHIYYENPGDSGLPPQLKLQDAAASLPLAFPAPHVISIPPITNYGYENAVVLTTSFTVPPAAGPQPLTFKGSFLYCKDICLPGTVTLPLALRAGPPRPNPAFQPAPLPAPLAAGAVGAAVAGPTLTLTLPNHLAVQGVHFIPAKDGVINDSAPQILQGRTLSLPLDDQAAAPPAAIRGLLILQGQGYTFSSPVAPGAAGAAAPGGGPASAALGLPAALFFAFLAGLILNLMPCVLPVLSLKLLGLVRHQHGPARARQTLAYTAGVLASFWLFAGVIALLQRGGAQLGWGFHLQNPTFVAALALLMLAVALNFFGVYELGSSLTRLGAPAQPRRHPLWQSFGTGALAVVVATPCTVPFMGGAMAYALTGGLGKGLAVFTALGLGMALPFLLSVPFPALFRWLPRPGNWMVTFRRLLGWPMLATALWLAWVFAAQTVGAGGPAPLFALLTAGLAFAFGLWLYGRRPSAATAVLAALAAGAGLYALPALTAQPTGTAPAWQPWSPAAVEQALSQGRPVLVDFTADWCITCKVTEATVLNTAAVRALFAATNTALLRGDWTRQDPAITAELARHGRKGVPLYLVYTPGRAQPRILPQLLTAGALRAALANGGAATP